METFTGYRDEILLGADGGDYYIQLYTDYSPAISDAVLQRPTLINRLIKAWDMWLPAVEAQVEGMGANFIITAQMQAALLGVMTEFEEVGDTALGQLNVGFKLGLDLENLVGRTTVDLQEDIESNPMEVQQTPWKELKASFR